MLKIVSTVVSTISIQGCMRSSYAKQLKENGQPFMQTQINPGWVSTKMGGSGATDDLQQGYEIQVWLDMYKLVR